MKILALVGPTAVGKSKIVESLLRKEERFIFISCDSRKIYRGMDIGTNKPKRYLRHYFRLIDIKDPSLTYSAQDFARDALRESKRAIERGKIPLVVGGTPLYYKALFFGLFEAPHPDQDIRKYLMKRLKEEGSESLYKELLRIDPETASKLHPRDWIRITRALEVYYQMKKPISLLRKERKNLNTPMPVAFGLLKDRKELYERINHRVDKMMSVGLFEEVKELVKRGYDLSAPGMKTIGYAEIFRHIKESLPLDVAVRLIKKRTRVYARKQMYFFRHLGPIKWFIAHRSPVEDILRKSDRIF